MKIMFVSLLLVCTLLFACDKEQTGKEQGDLTKICFKGRYLGEGCWPVIQVLEPLDERFIDSKWGKKDNTRWPRIDSIYEYAVGTGPLPDKYKDGKPFYFTIDTIILEPIHTTDCAIPKYTIAIHTYSDSVCKVSD